jgi:hypothetical protein
MRVNSCGFVSGADGIGDTEGKAAMGSGERAGRQASFKFVSCADEDFFRYRRRAERLRSIDADFHRLPVTLGKAKISREVVSLSGAAAPIGAGGEIASSASRSRRKAQATAAVSMGLRLYVDDVGIGTGTVAVICP